jgi:hypothetical protein
MSSKPLTTVLASYNSRNRIVRDREGNIHLFWRMLSIKMTQSEFLSFVGLVVDAAGRAAGCGELAMCPCGRAVRCSMGQIMLSHSSLTLWFSPEEFDEFYWLAATARQRLADTASLPRLGVPWTAPSRGLENPN